VGEFFHFSILAVNVGGAFDFTAISKNQSFPKSGDCTGEYLWLNFKKPTSRKTLMHILGIDVGGSGIKGAPVDIESGELLAERIRIKTPKNAEPEPVAEVVKQIAQSFNWNAPIGIGFPAPIKGGVAMMAANISEKWVGVNAGALFAKITGCECTLVNDADAAGLAEMSFGAGRGQPGTVIMLTLGTGIGTAIFHRGQLLPNAEFGHLEVDGEDAECPA
jgi:polyphosphate glucokinase